MHEIDFLFCPKCSDSFHPHGENLLVCNSCGLQFYINPKPTNGTIIKNVKGELLLVKRSLDPKKGMWDVPGGFVDINETAEESVRREIQEEIGGNVTALSYLGSTIGSYDFGFISSHTLCLWFTVTLEKMSDLKPGDDAEELRFFPIKDIPWNDIAFECVKEGLQLFL